MSLSLVWQSGLHFKSGPDGPSVALASSVPGVPSPMHALAYAVMGCMAMDVVHVLQKGRHDLRGLTVAFEGDRAAETPKRYTSMHLHFTVTGAVPEEAVARAIQLSRDKYCSVFATLRPDLDFRTSVTITP
jgi:putative redox protein